MKNIILCCYNLIGCEILSQLVKQKHNIFVYTHKSPYHIPDLVAFCEKEKIQYTTDRINLNNLPFKPDILCSIYYRYIISEDIINYCDGRAFNLHPSILPDYKGCSSITWAILNNEKFTGYTYHYMDSGIDTGDIIVQKKIKINDYDTQITLYFKVMLEAFRDFDKVFDFVMEKRKGSPQKESGKYFKRGVPHGGIISEEWDLEKTKRFIKAMIHPPYPLAKFEDKEIENLNSYIDLINERKHIR